MNATIKDIVRACHGNPITLLAIAVDLEAAASELRQIASQHAVTLTAAEKRYCRLERIKQRDFLAKKTEVRLRQLRKPPR